MLERSPAIFVQTKGTRSLALMLVTIFIITMMHLVIDIVDYINDNDDGNGKRITRVTSSNETCINIFFVDKGNPLSEAVDTQMDVWLQGIEDGKAAVQVQVGEGVVISPQNELQLSNTVHNAFQNAVLQKETAVLRQQCSLMQASCADLQRQLDRFSVPAMQHYLFYYFVIINIAPSGISHARNYMLIIIVQR